MAFCEVMTSTVFLEDVQIVSDLIELFEFHVQLALLDVLPANLISSV